MCSSSVKCENVTTSSEWVKCSATNPRPPSSPSSSTRRRSSRRRRGAGKVAGRGAPPSASGPSPCSPRAWRRCWPGTTWAAEVRPSPDQVTLGRAPRLRDGVISNPGLELCYFCLHLAQLRAIPSIPIKVSRLVIYFYAV